MSMICVSEKVKPSSMRRQRRREKSRDAARFRRHKESDTFDEICNTIPIPHDIVHHLDKSAVMRLLISYIKLRQSINGKISTIPSTPEVKQEYLSELNSLTDDDYVNALNAFILILSSDLDILYVSENVKEYLGLSKLELIGQSILTYAHEGDHDEIRNCFNNRQEDSASQRTFFLRLKSTLTVSGKSINLKSASYKVLRCSGVIRSDADSSSFVAHVEPIPHPANIEHFLDSRTFVTQHSPDMKFTCCDELFCQLMNYSESEMLGHSFFDFCHVRDMKSIGHFFQKLYRLNQMETDQYRFLSKNGGYHWMVTQATVISNQKNHKPQCIVCVHYVISGAIHKEIAFSSEQWDSVKDTNPDSMPCLDRASLHSVDSFEMEALCDDCSDAEDFFEPTSKAAAKQTPVRDDCSIAPITFADRDDSEDLFVNNDIFYNAPSIGDPWSYSTEEGIGRGNIDDLFTDVVLEPQASNPGLLVAAEASLPNKASLNINFNRLATDTSSSSRPFYAVTPCGSLSPCDSAYCGSPPRPDSSFNCDQVELSNRSRPYPKSSPLCVRDINELPVYQPIGVPRDKFEGHINNLKRGFVDTSLPGAVYQWPDKSKALREKASAKQQDAIKRRRLERNGAVLQRNAYEQSVEMKEFPCTGRVNNPQALLQPGDCFGFQEPNIMDMSAPSFLLQPEMNFSGKTGRRIARNMSSSYLPVLSVQDCEVNAPLPTDVAFVPRGMECVHFLDDL